MLRVVTNVKRCRCISPITVLCAFSLGLLVSHYVPSATLVVVLALALLILAVIRVKR